MINAWILRPYPYGMNRMSQFLNEGFIAIGWPGIGDLYSCSRSCIYEKVSALYISDYGDPFCRDSSNTILKFKDKMLIGEIILVVPFSDDSLEIAIGIIDSSYFFDARYDETITADTGYNGFSHRRKVIWLEKRFPRSLLPEAVKKAFSEKTIHPLPLEGYNRLVELLESRGHKLNERWEMSQHRKDLIETSMKTVLETMQQQTPDLADTFDKIAQESFEIFQESETVHFDLLSSKLSSVAVDIEESHLIPTDLNAVCQKLCISMAIDKWEGEQGFCEVAKKSMTYWLECLEENSGTIFFTSAWDEIDFIAHCKQQFDAYAKKHDIVVILVSANGFLITYIGE